MRPLAHSVCTVIALTMLLACSGGGSSPGPGGGPGPGGTPTPVGPTQAPTSVPTGAPTASPTGGSAPFVPSAGSIYLGAFVNPTDGTGGTDSVNIALLEKQIGRTFALSLHYFGWTTAFPGPDQQQDGQAGRIPIISWNCGTTDANVAAGTEDANIRSHADALRAYGKPIFLRYKWEMTLPAGTQRSQCANPAHDTKGYFSPTDFVAAWNHIRAIFVARGATNVAFMWNPSGGSPQAPGPYYPGNASVDWIGIDEYDRSDVPFGKTYDVYAQVANYSKPIIIAETGANPLNQPAFFSGAVAALKSTYPEVKGFVYFDSPGNGMNWNFTDPGLAAFKTMSSDPYFSAIAN